MLYIFIHLFCSCFMLVRLSVAPEAIPETLGMRPAWMGRQSIAVHYAHTFAHLFTPGAVSSCQFFSRHVFVWRNRRNPCRHRVTWAQDWTGDRGAMIGLAKWKIVERLCQLWCDKHSLVFVCANSKNKWRKTSPWNNPQRSCKCFTPSNHLN